MISLHIVVDQCPPELLDLGLWYLKETDQPLVNIAGGTQLDLTMQYAERVRRELPNIIIHFRILEDTGIVIALTPQQWYIRYVVPRLKWLRDNRIVLVVDNETSGSNAVIKLYVDRSISIANMLHEVQLNGAFCRFATGNINDGKDADKTRTDQYPLLTPLLAALNDKDWVSPNEYTNAKGKSSAGHLARWENIKRVAPAGKSLNFSIGEAGILVDYQAKHGWHVSGMTDEEVAYQILADEQWYEGGRIPRCAFTLGGNLTDWGTLQLSKKILEVWVAYYKAHPILPMKRITGTVVIVPPSTPIPPVVLPPIPAPAPEPTITMPLSVLQTVITSMKLQRDSLNTAATQLMNESNTLRSTSLQIKGGADDLSGDINVLDAIIQKVTRK